MLKTVDEIAQHIISNNSVQELNKLFNPTDMWEDRKLRIEFPRWIRNTYKLWDVNHPLTKPWHDGKRLFIESGPAGSIDCTKQHPDQVSAAIMRQVKKLIAP